MSKKIKGVIYNFYPVVLNDDADKSWSAVDESLRWKLFGWWFEMYTFLRQVTATAMGVEQPPFMIKVKEKDLKEINEQ